MMESSDGKDQTSNAGELPDSLFLTDIPKSDDGPAAQTLSFSRSPTVLLAFAANRFTRNASRFYAEKFGIGAMDWRMLVMLTRKPGSSVSLASQTIGIDKGAVSRCLTRLQKLQLVKAEIKGTNERRRSWVLTKAGSDLHDKILCEALRRQKKLLEGFSQRDVEELNRLLSQFLDNLDALGDEIEQE